MPTMNNEEPRPEQHSKTISYFSLPALVTALVLSVVLFLGALLVWYLLGPGVRAQVTLPQAATLLFIVLFMVAAMLSVGYSHLWAAGGEVVIRNGPVMRRYQIDEIAGLRLRKGDPWAYLLIKDPNSESGTARKAVLAIQSLEGDKGQQKVRRLRRWLKENGATSEGITKEIT